MKNLIRPVALLLAASPLLALAAFDLTWVKRYNPSQLVATRFEKSVTRSGGNGFYVAGVMGDDAFVALFDLSGNVVTLRMWDSPLVSRQSDVDLWVDGSDVYLHALSTSESTIVKFDANLNKTLEIPLGRGLYLVAYNATSDRFYVAPYSNAEHTGVRCISAAGAQLWTCAQTIGQIYAIAVDPADGCFIGGTTNQFEVIDRISSAGTMVYHRTGPGTADFSRKIDSIAVTTGSVAAAGGTSFDGAESRATIFTLAANGAFTRQYLPGGANGGFSKISLVSGNTYRGIFKVQGGVGRVVEVNRSTGAISRTYLPASNDVDGDASAYGQMPNSMLAIGHMPGNRDSTLSVWNSSTGNYLYRSNDAAATYHHFGYMGSPVGIGVGDRDNLTGLIRLFTPTTTSTIGYQFAGGTRKELIEAIPLAQGAYALCFKSTIDPQNATTSTTVVKYNANGTLAWARTLAVPAGESFTASDMTSGPDGAIYLCGSGASATIFKLNGTTGAQIYRRAFFDGEGQVIFDEIAVDALNQPHVLGYVEPSYQVYRELLVKFDASGQPLTRTKVDSGNQPRFEAMHFAPNGNLVTIATPWVIAVGVFSSFQVRQYNASLSLAQTYAIDPSTTASKTAIRWAWDAQNDFIVAASFTVPETRIVRFPAGTVAATNFATTLPGSSGVFGVASSPARDRIYLLHDYSPSVLRAVQTSNGASAWWNSLIPAVEQPTGLTIDADGSIYVLGPEVVGTTTNVYAAKYLTNGVRSAQRRLAGLPFRIHAPSGQGVRIIGSVGTRNKNWGPFIARYD